MTIPSQYCASWLPAAALSFKPGSASFRNRIASDVSPYAGTESNVQPQQKKDDSMKFEEKEFAREICTSDSKMSASVIIASGFCAFADF
jgi:hypothetical protein